MRQASGGQQELLRIVVGDRFEIHRVEGWNFGRTRLEPLFPGETVMETRTL